MAEGLNAAADLNGRDLNACVLFLPFSFFFMECVWEGLTVNVYVPLSLFL